jgi:hypothetical protein
MKKANVVDRFGQSTTSAYSLTGLRHSPAAIRKVIRQLHFDRIAWTSNSKTNSA